MDPRDAARRALAALDLTNLDEACEAADVTDLCVRAVTPHGAVAAVCLWPRFVAQARRELEGTPVRIATVVNFPTGEEPLKYPLADAAKALADGADEIDFVVPWRRLAAGHDAAVLEAVREMKAACGRAPLKAILETGELKAPALIRRAADAALLGGADFLKTSTGKVPVNATPAAAEILLLAIRDADLAAGLKAAGGVRTTADAATYLGLCDRIMGEGWATPQRFRIGASGVLAALLATLDGAEAPAAREGY